MSKGIDLKRAEAALKRAAYKAMHGTPEERSGRAISSTISRIDYDQPSRTLVIRFGTGRAYEYADVPSDVYRNFRSAVSKGIFFNTHIRDRYRYREVRADHA
jgi:lysyl-tRNA synthetase class 2